MITRLVRLPALLSCSAGVLLSFALLGPAGARAETGKNIPVLLAKFNFEDTPAFIPNWGAGYKSTYKPATGWKAPFVVKLDADDPHSGAKSLRFDLLQNQLETESAAGERLVHSPQIEIPAFASAAPGKLVLHCSVRTRGVVEGGVGIRILERNEKHVSLGLLSNQESLVEIPETAVWREFKAEGPLRKGTRSVAFMVVMYARQQAPATVWLDDISLEYQSAP